MIEAIAGYVLFELCGFQSLAFIFMTNLTAAVEVLAIGQRTEFSLLTPNEK